MPRVLRVFETEKRARKFARAYDTARAFNKLPLLEVMRDGDGMWLVVNPDPDAVPHGPRMPVN